MTAPWSPFKLTERLYRYVDPAPTSTTSDSSTNQSPTPAATAGPSRYGHLALNPSKYCTDPRLKVSVGVEMDMDQKVGILPELGVIGSCNSEERRIKTSPKSLSPDSNYQLIPVHAAQDEQAIPSTSYSAGGPSTTGHQNRLESILNPQCDSPVTGSEPSAMDVDVQEGMVQPQSSGGVGSSNRSEERGTDVNNTVQQATSSAGFPREFRIDLDPKALDNYEEISKLLRTGGTLEEIQKRNLASYTRAAILAINGTPAPIPCTNCEETSMVCLILDEARTCLTCVNRRRGCSIKHENDGVGMKRLLAKISPSSGGTNGKVDLGEIEHALKGKRACDPQDAAARVGAVKAIRRPPGRPAKEQGSNQSVIRKRRRVDSTSTIHSTVHVAADPSTSSDQGSEDEDEESESEEEILAHKNIFTQDLILEGRRAVKQTEFFGAQVYEHAQQLHNPDDARRARDKRPRISDSVGSRSKSSTPHAARASNRRSSSVKGNVTPQSQIQQTRAALQQDQPTGSTSGSSRDSAVPKPQPNRQHHGKIVLPSEAFELAKVIQQRIMKILAATGTADPGLQRELKRHWLPEVRSLKHFRDERAAAPLLELMKDLMEDCKKGIDTIIDPEAKVDVGDFYEMLVIRAGKFRRMLMGED